VAADTGVEIIAWPGIARSMSALPQPRSASFASSTPAWSCWRIRSARLRSWPKRIFAGSTAAMIEYVGTEKPARVVLVTECSMSDNVAVDHPEIEFVRPCNLCPHMRQITLPKIRRALETLTHEVTIDPAVAVGARRRSSACSRFKPASPTRRIKARA